jgi:hypothetical protein
MEKVRQHGLSKRRTWRKLHLVVDANTQHIVAAELTANFVGDSEVLPDLLKQLPDSEAIATLARRGWSLRYWALLSSDNNETGSGIDTTTSGCSGMAES